MYYRCSIAVVFAALLSGCGLSDKPVQTKFYADCVDHTKTVGTVDWSKAKTITLTYGDPAGSAAVLSMVHGKPYILRIENKENFPHWFRAVDFLRDSQISKTLYNQKEQPSKCLEGLAMAPASTAEIHLVPVMINDYEFEDSPFVVPALGEILWNSDTGYIFVR